ncbi:hypothetical protein R6Q59_025619 [Mikania micrantha]
MEQFEHFSHEHPLSLVQLHPRQENSNKEDELEDGDGVEYGDGDDFWVKEDNDFGKCEMCKEDIYWFHLCYYYCKDCNYSIHKLCAQLPKTIQDHPLHPGHDLTFSQECQLCDPELKFRAAVDSQWACDICNISRPKLLIQQFTNGSFSHSHMLTLSYSFPYIERKAKFLPICRVCEGSFQFNKWLYRCDRCRYYAHVSCVTTRKDAFMSYLTYARPGKTYKNFKDDDHPNLIRCPYPDESSNLLMHHFINKGKLPIKGKIDGDMFSHEHPLVHFDTQTSLFNKTVSLHDPVNRVQLLCNGCVRPIADIPFYKCLQHSCDFVLHEWCTRLPSEIQDHHDHPEHTLVLMQKAPTYLGVFWCEICLLPCNGFAYGCKQCEYYVDVNCGFIPDVITHEAHPNHLLQRFKPLAHEFSKKCEACYTSSEDIIGYYCHPCDFFLHNYCALLLPGTIRHRYDKHPLNLRYQPAENHASEYFCEICEDEIDPISYWFYHCSTCASTMHTTCAPLKLQCEQSTSSFTSHSIFKYYNVKFGRRYKIQNHQHNVTFVQGINADGQCAVCHQQLQNYMIFKCFMCKYAIHPNCVYRKPA